METESGLCIRRALQIKAALECGFRMTLDDVRADEFSVLVVIRGEVAKYEQEKAEERAESVRQQQFNRGHR
ncbi:MAG TPA: hypothetical protein VHB50_14290 [Bryobacteraceae bacterium]|nr:hypothetical protein [Bryobacteraceae bacterium]